MEKLKLFYWKEINNDIIILNVYKKNNYILKTNQKSDFLPIEPNKSDIELEKHWQSTYINGYLFKAEKNFFSNKEMLLSYFLDFQNNLMCEIFEIQNETAEKIFINSLFKFNLLNKEYNLIHKQSLFYNEFIVKDPINNKDCFYLRYSFPLKNKILYKEWGHNIKFKELVEDYKDKKYLKTLEQRFKSNNTPE